MREQAPAALPTHTMEEIPAERQKTSSKHTVTHESRDGDAAMLLDENRKCFPIETSMLNEE